MKNLEIEILQQSFVDPEWSIARAKSAPDKVGVVPNMYLKSTVDDDTIYENLENQKVDFNDKKSIWILYQKNKQLTSQLKQVTEKCTELEESVRVYSSCVICFETISSRCSLSCGHTFW